MPNFMATLLATAGGVKKTIQKNREQTEKKQVAGTGFKGLLQNSKSCQVGGDKYLP